MLFTLLQAKNDTDVSKLLFVGSFAMIILAVGIIIFVMMHQRKVIKYHIELKRLEAEKQAIYLNASIRFQEQERQRIAADLHDDAGPLLATCRLYLNENLVQLDKEQQLRSILNAKGILDEAIQLVRNISHSLMPPTLKNFGLESATVDLFQKISGSGMVNASARFHDYRERLQTDEELLLFRIIQELVNNVLKHSNSAFIHLTQNSTKTHMYVRIHHDGKGMVQTDYDKLSFTASGLGLKNIAGRVKLLKARIFFEIDSSNTYYKVTIEIPKI